jgi:hypothetical protein
MLTGNAFKTERKFTICQIGALGHNAYPVYSNRQVVFRFASDFTGVAPHAAVCVMVEQLSVGAHKLTS